MKKVGDIMSEMGFRKDAPESLKESFLKYLIKNATGVDVQTPTEKRSGKSADSKSFEPKANKKIESQVPTQLSFNFEESEDQKKIKVS